jgi:hypothetical protein
MGAEFRWDWFASIKVAVLVIRFEATRKSIPIEG